MLVWLPEQHHKPCSYTPSKMFTFLKGFLMTISAATVDYKTDPTDKSCCLCSDHLMALIHKSVKEGKIVAGLSYFQKVLIQSNKGEVT